MRHSSAYAADGLDAATRQAYSRAVARLPVTMQPGLNQKLAQWENLFPYEREQLLVFLDGLAQFSPAQLAELTRPLVELESEMGVAHWPFSAVADTVENASLLARSSHYGAWRQEVDRVFAAIEKSARDSMPAAPAAGRAVLLVLPQELPVRSIAGAAPWSERGAEFFIEGDPAQVCALALSGPASLLAAAQQGVPEGEHGSECWMIDAGAEMGALLPSPRPSVSLLEYGALLEFRDRFLAQVNTIPKDIHGADEILAQMRREDWSAHGPAALAGQARLRNFVVELFLSGNGALIFSNAFVEWAAAEAMRRARPRLMVCRFGMRSRPKPFTGIAIFENQKTISALRDEDDPEGSAIDAAILARYVWLAVARYAEGARTSVVCIAEASRRAYAIAPEHQAPPATPGSRMTPDALVAWMRAGLMTG